MTAYAARARPASPTAALFGAVMALVALTVGFATLGVYLGRDSGGAAWFVAWLLSLGCLIGLNVASRRGQTGVALVLLFAFGALTGWAVAWCSTRCPGVRSTGRRRPTSRRCRRSGDGRGPRCVGCTTST